MRRNSAVFSGKRLSTMSGRQANELSWGPDFAQDIADREANGHPGVTYWKQKEDGKFGFDYRAERRFQKYGAEVLGLIGTNSSGDDLGKTQVRFVTSNTVGTIPIGLDLRRIDLSREGLVFSPRLDRVATSAFDVRWNYIEDDVAADFIASSRDSGDDIPNTAVQNDTYDTHTVNMRGLYAVGQVTDLAAAVAGDGRGLYQEVFDAKLRAMDLAEETQDLLSQTDGDAQGYLGGYELWDAATYDANSTALELTNLDTLLTSIAGVNLPRGLQGVTFGITDYATHASILQQLQGYARMEATSTAFGAPAPMPVVYRGISIHPSQVMPTGANVKRLYLNDLSQLKMYTVMDKVFIPLARTLTAAAGPAFGQQFAIESWLTLVDFSAADETNSDGTGGVSHGAAQELS